MRTYLRTVVEKALDRLGISPDSAPAFEKPRGEEHGDLTTSIAFVLGKRLHRNPRELAQQIIELMDVDKKLVQNIECAGPGFINVKFTELFFQQQLGEIPRCGDAFGRSTRYSGRRVQVEFVSANPTGPLTVGHGRGAVYGDTVARLLEWTGHIVEREYYFNNAGRQMRILGESVRLRYLELLGDTIVFPEEYYQGEYIKEIAGHLVEEHGGSLREEPATGRFKEQAEGEIFEDIKKTLKSLDITFDSFYNEHSLYETGKITNVIEDLRGRDLVYEQEGAVWFRASRLGNEKDKVIVKSSGEPTYRLPDIAYHREKFARGYDMMIDVFGADHVATYPDVLAALKALDYDTGKIKVLIHQFVTITQNGEVVKMSTRKANFITLDELIADVGAAVVRYFFLMRTIASHLNFDIELARKQSDDNPVYYLQYAHARIASILRFAGQEGKISQAPPEYALLNTLAEQDLIKNLLEFPDMVESCALSYEPHRLADYLQVIAGMFHRFYHECRVVTEDIRLTNSRLSLCRATQIVMKNGLTILGIPAPESM